MTSLFQKSARLVSFRARRLSLSLSLATSGLPQLPRDAGQPVGRLSAPRVRHLPGPQGRVARPACVTCVNHTTRREALSCVGTQSLCARARRFGSIHRSGEPRALWVPFACVCFRRVKVKLRRWKVSMKYFQNVVDIVRDLMRAARAFFSFFFFFRVSTRASSWEAQSVFRSHLLVGSRYVFSSFFFFKF